MRTDTARAIALHLRAIADLLDRAEAEAPAGITAQQLAAIYSVPVVAVERWESPINAAMARYDINTTQRRAAFLAQIGHESQRLARVVENLNYSTGALMISFGRHRISEADAQRYGRIDGVQAANQEAIANALYGGQWGARELGNTQNGDGWRYRGRGLIQITGRANYERCGRALRLPLLDQPELLEQPEHAAMSAAWFWAWRDLNPLADAGNTEAITRRINGGDKGLAERITLYQSALVALA